MYMLDDDVINVLSTSLADDAVLLKKMDFYVFGDF